MKLRTIAFALSATLWMGGAQAALIEDVFFFGDSLTDAGNNAAVLPGVTPVPIPDNFIATFPYASGHYTDGPVWAQSFASALGLSANASLTGGTNYAFGGARTGPIDPTLPFLSQIPPSLTTQSALFLAQYGNVAPSNALYVVAGGGNNARDTADAILAGADPLPTIAAASAAFAADIKGIVDNLQAAGAADIIVWKVPDIGQAPAVRALGPDAVDGASFVAASMNDALVAALFGEQGVKIFDMFQLVDSVVQDPGAYMLSNVEDACAALANCNPSEYLFWDGVHPSSAGHAIFAKEMLALAVPEPSTWVLLLAGLGLLIAVRLRAA